MSHLEIITRPRLFKQNSQHKSLTHTLAHTRMQALPKIHTNLHIDDVCVRMYVQYLSHLLYLSLDSYIFNCNLSLTLAHTHAHTHNTRTHAYKIALLRSNSLPSALLLLLRCRHFASFYFLVVYVQQCKRKRGNIYHVHFCCIQIITLVLRVLLFL